MGLPHRQLYATNTGDESGKIILTAWIPEKKEDGYHWPAGTPLGGDIWVNNTILLKEEEGTVPVMIVQSEEETGIWLICEDGYFKDEQWIYNYKPRFKKADPKKLDYSWSEANIEGDDIFGIHISTDIDMTAGDGPLPVTMIRGEYKDYYSEPEKKSIWKKILNLFKI